MFTFWGWQAVIIAAVITLPMGLSQSKEYAELEWPIDVLITIVWVSFAIVFFGILLELQHNLGMTWQVSDQLLFHE